MNQSTVLLIFSQTCGAQEYNKVDLIVLETEKSIMLKSLFTNDKLMLNSCTKSSLHEK